MELLPIAETEELARCEATIERGLGTFLEVGNALFAIRDGRLYRQTHGSFDDYCRDRWGMSRQRANQLVDAAKVAANLTTTVVRPETESQARPLARLEPERQREAWQRAVELAPNGKPTARHVEAAVAVVNGNHHPLPGQQTLIEVEDADEALVDEASDEESEAFDLTAEAPDGEAQARKWNLKLSRLRNEIELVVNGICHDEGLMTAAPKWFRDNIKSTEQYMKELRDAADFGIRQFRSFRR